MKQEQPRVFRRSFMRDVQDPLLKMDHCHVQPLAEVSYPGISSRPLFLVQYPRTFHPGKPTILLSGGVHGDEPAGVYTVIDWLRNRIQEQDTVCNAYVFPCVNPSGFELDTRFAANGVDLNRSFNKETEQQEVQAIEQWLRATGVRFAFTMDCHEVPADASGEGFTEKDNPHACFLFETMADVRHRIGPQLIAALPNDMEVCQWPEVYTEKNTGGVVAYPEACAHPPYAEDATFEGYMNGVNKTPKQYTDHSFTTETPTVWEMEKRIRTQTIWIQTAIELLLKRR
ncbi:hypothetical protein COU77_02715 [Candidatus Peregrinibacteria bacterium CG10_big_fil_rev_8_21_14_0_10_49_16]|nr:MAG: hypothetical protein COW95_02225 [Candidatus Peregrinibacteria bacterium CG22_combo_CG10-13_8_21_14_all_49_11]PIR51951.1 MAG: hypothetical protein COU77_02715 [Candidatus Peregrinibacteria bacterium CG10_big_fil_rev_8_21_14_0_10_49_16]